MVNFIRWNSKRFSVNTEVLSVNGNYTTKCKGCINLRLWAKLSCSEKIIRGKCCLYLKAFESTKIFKTKELNKLRTQKNKNNNNTTKTDISGYKVRMGETKCASSCGTNPKQQMTNKICWASMGCSVFSLEFLVNPLDQYKWYCP